MNYMNAWLKRCVFNLDLNRESVSEPRTLSGWLFQSLGAKYEKVKPPLVDFEKNKNNDIIQLSTLPCQFLRVLMQEGGLSL